MISGVAELRQANAVLNEVKGNLRDEKILFNENVEVGVMIEIPSAALTADIREVYAEAKGMGFDTKIMRQVVRIRRLDKADRQEQEAVLDLYLSALGMRN